MEIRADPSQFRSTANPVRHVSAGEVIGRLISKKEYKKNKFSTLIKNNQELRPYDLDHTGERAVVGQ